MPNVDSSCEKKFCVKTGIVIIVDVKWQHVLKNRGCDEWPTTHSDALLEGSKLHLLELSDISGRVNAVYLVKSVLHSLFTSGDLLHFFVGQSSPSSSSIVCFQSYQLSVRI